MANILMASVIITGTRALLWHAFTPDAIPLVKQERSGVAGNDPNEWKKTVLLTAERQLYLPRAAIFSCLRDAARYTRQGRGSIQPKLAATLQVFEDRILVDRVLPDDLTTDPTAPVYLDIQSVVNPGTRARNVRYRIAASSGWTTSATLFFDRTIVSRTELEAVLHDAGRLVGLGNGRQIGYGRFRVNAFTVTTMIEVAHEAPLVIEHEDTR